MGPGKDHSLVAINEVTKISDRQAVPVNAQTLREMRKTLIVLEKYYNLA